MIILFILICAFYRNIIHVLECASGKKQFLIVFNVCKLKPSKVYPLGIKRGEILKMYDENILGCQKSKNVNQWK